MRIISLFLCPDYSLPGRCRSKSYTEPLNPDHIPQPQTPIEVRSHPRQQQATNFHIASLSPNRNTLVQRRWTNAVLNPLHSGFRLFQLLRARLPIQETALLHRASALCAARASQVDIAIAAATLVGIAYAGGREVGYVFWERVLGANAAGVDAAGFSGLGQCVVAGVEVLALFEVLG